MKKVVTFSLFVFFLLFVQCVLLQAAEPQKKMTAGKSKPHFAKGKDLTDLMDLFTLGKQGKIEAIGQLYQNFLQGDQVDKDNLSHFYNASLWSALAMHDTRKALRLAQIGVDHCDAYLKSGDRDVYAPGDEGVFFERLNLLRARAQILALGGNLEEAKASADEVRKMIVESLKDAKTARAWAQPQRLGTVINIQQSAIPVLEAYNRVEGATGAANLSAWITEALDVQSKILNDLGKNSEIPATINDNYARMTMQSRGLALLLTGKAPEAVKIFESLSLSGVDPKTNPWLAYPYIYLGRALAAAGREKEALEKLTKAEEILGFAAKSGNMVSAFSRWWASFYIGEIQEAAGRLDEAAKAFGAATSHLRDLYSNVTSTVARREYTKESDKVYARLIRILLEQKKVAEALDKIEESQSKELLDLFGDTLKNQKRFWPQDLKDKEESLKKKLIELEKELDKSDSSTRGGSTGESPDIWRSKRLKLQTDYEQVMVEGSLKARELEEKKGPDRLLQKRLENGLKGQNLCNRIFVDRPDTVTLVFQTKEDPCWALILGSGKREAVKLTTPAAKIRSLVFRLRKAITADKPDWRKNSQELYQALFAPLEDHLKGKDKLLIIPDGVLWYIPMPAIVDGNDKLFIDRFSLGIIPGFGLAANLLAKKAPAPTKQLLVFANPDGSLPNASKEGKNIEELAGKQTSAKDDAWKIALSLEEKATKSVFMDALKKSWAGIHFATHGVLDEANPLYSYLVLKEGPQDNGRLEIQDILNNLDLSAVSLAVLSACNTAMGAMAGGNEVMCLQTAFQEAGISTVIASLWEVSDESTARLMTGFYTNLFSGKTPAESLTASMRAMTLEPPSRWAPFQLYGLP